MEYVLNSFFITIIIISHNFANICEERERDLKRERIKESETEREREREIKKERD